MDKEKAIQEIMDMITPLPPEEQEVILKMIEEKLKELRGIK